MRPILSALAAGLVLLPASATTGQEQPPAPAAPAPPQQPTVAHTAYVHPPRTVRRTVRFRPPSRPSPAYVRDVILPYEAARAGASLAHLRARAFCESGFHWWAKNGQYHGIGQFAASTFWRGVSTIGSRSIRWTSVRLRRAPVVRVRTYTDGTVLREPRWTNRQRVITTRRGRLRPGAFDAWTEARIMAQAMVGRSAVRDSEWSCR